MVFNFYAPYLFKGGIPNYSVMNYIHILLGLWATLILASSLGKEDFERIKTMIQGQNLINVQTNEDFASVYSVPLLQGEG